ncbi:Nuclear transport factor 2 domain [Dillenia turbinata]|uniref:Nuclear transport factor 2 domain n=1 Tax=Dillenia turbinata TaxID=194707 RepID=A0AAN8ZKP5_9MAGN
MLRRLAQKQIHTLIKSLHFVEIEIKAIDSLETWNEGLLVMVSDVIRMKDYVVRENLSESLFLAPQKKDYFVVNHFSELHLEEYLNLENFYVLGEEARDSVNSVHVEGEDPFDQFSLPEQPLKMKNTCLETVAVESSLKPTLMSCKVECGLFACFSSHLLIFWLLRASPVRLVGKRLHSRTKTKQHQRFPRTRREETWQDLMFAAAQHDLPWVMGETSIKPSQRMIKQ